MNPCPVIVLANWFEFRKAERIAQPCVQSRMLLWAVHGKGRVRVNGQWYRLEPEDYLFLPWGREMLYEADPEQTFRVGGIHLIPDYHLSKNIDFSVAHDPDDPLAQSPWRTDWDWSELVGIQQGSLVQTPTLRLLAHYIVGRFIGESVAEKPMRALATLLLEELIVAHTKVDYLVSIPVALRKIQDYVKANLQKTLTIPELARVAECSPASLHRLFKQFSASTPSAWVTATRITKAKQLLCSTTLPIYVIAAQIGIVDPFHFSKLFKRVVGQSPQVFRRQTRLL